jgi:hypothetical protein
MLAESSATETLFKGLDISRTYYLQSRLPSSLVFRYSAAFQVVISSRWSTSIDSQLLALASSNLHSKASRQMEICKRKVLTIQNGGA